MVDVTELSSCAERRPSVQWHTTIDFPATTTTPDAARRVTTTLLALWGLPDLCDDAALIVTELMSNALQHAPGTERLQLELAGDSSGVQIRVPDESTAVPVIRGLAPTVASGRGMRLVAHLATEWGAEPCRGGKFVWARLQRASWSN